MLSYRTLTIVIWEFDTIIIVDTVESALPIEEIIAGSLETINVISERSEDAPYPVIVPILLLRELVNMSDTPLPRRCV